MNYYELAEDEIKAIEVLFNSSHYRHVIQHSCLCLEYLLKSKLVQIEPTSELLYGHDIINIFKAVQEKYSSSKDLTSVIKFCRKYFNETRYPSSGTSIYTEEFAKQFRQYVDTVKHYIDNECFASIEDLANKYNQI